MDALFSISVSFPAGPLEVGHTAPRKIRFATGWTDLVLTDRWAANIRCA